jgi:hypothetical protein
MFTIKLGTAEYDIGSGKILMPRTGPWTADLTVIADGPLTGSAVATMGGVDMPCHIQRSEMLPGKLDLRLVGGNGGLGSVARKKHYKGVTVRQVFHDLLADAGETAAPACEAATLNAPLKAWTSLAVPTGQLLQALVESVDDEVSWRVLYDGKVWIGHETWPACPADVRILHADGANASQLLGTDALGIWPGPSIAGRRVDYVVHEIGSENRSTVHWAEAHL